MKKKIISLIVCIALLMVPNINVLAAEPGISSQPSRNFTQEEISKLSENIIYSEEIPVYITNNGSRGVVQAWVTFNVHYDAALGLAFSTKVEADALIQSISGIYSWNSFGTGSLGNLGFYTSQIIPYGHIYNYEMTDYFYNSGDQLRCTTSGTISCIGGEGTFTKTALVTIP